MDELFPGDPVHRAIGILLAAPNNTAPLPSDVVAGVAGLGLAELAVVGAREGLADLASVAEVPDQPDHLTLAITARVGACSTAPPEEQHDVESIAEPETPNDTVVDGAKIPVLTSPGETACTVNRLEEFANAGVAGFAETTHTAITVVAGDIAIGVIKRISSRAEDDENAVPSDLLCDEDFEEIMAYA